MGNSAVVCPWVRGMSGCVLYVVSEVVRKFCIWHEGVGWKFLGGYFGFYVSCDVSGIVASIVRGASETCVVCHCSWRGINQLSSLWVLIAGHWVLGFGRASVSCVCPCCIAEEMFHPQRVILIWFRDCSVPFRVMQQMSVVAGQMPILWRSWIKVLVGRRVFSTLLRWLLCSLSVCYTNPASA